MAEKYSSNVEIALKTLKLDPKTKSHVSDYLADSRHYYAKGDYVTSLVASSYAEGLIDGASLSRGEPTRWTSTTRKVLLVGTWDIVHPGHIEFLWRGKRLGKVYVIVARDENVAASKGRPPLIPQRQRAEVLRNLKPVDHVVLGDKSNFLKPVAKIRPDIILLGPDETYPVDKLKVDLRKMGLRCRVMKLSKRFTKYPLSSTSQIIAKAAKLANPLKERG